MDNSRMSTADMLQYCDEALAWDDFGPIDTFFFQSVKKILLGQCSALEEPEENDDLMGIERPVRDVELEPEYGNYADIYYGEEGDDDIPDYSATAEDEAFASEMFKEGFFNDPEGETENAAAEAEMGKTAKKPAAKKKSAKKASSKKASKKSEVSAEPDKHEETADGGFTVKL